jgi:hypothetical protein
MPTSAAVAGGAQDRNARGDTPSTLAGLPSVLTCPPSTGSTARTPPSAAIRASCAAVKPPGTEATRSGTTSRSGAGPRTPAVDGPGVPGSGVTGSGEAALAALAGLAGLAAPLAAAKLAPGWA